tara:strand:- start:89331 stop:89519 length:189 start_codon:yes stop_codon:yes gene_type:complete
MKGTKTMYYEMYKDVSGYWRWRLIAANGRIVADSGEGYHNRADCLHGISLVKSAYNAPVRER